MSNCYDHSIKKNMLSTVYGSKEDLKKDILKNYQELQKWYEEQCKLYKRPLVVTSTNGTKSTLAGPGKKTTEVNKQKILINHWRWLEANGYKKEAASCKLQAASLTRLNYNVIGTYRRKNYESKRSSSHHR